MEQHVRDYWQRFPEHWEQMMDAYHADGADGFALMAHASYLFRTHGVRWAMDISLPPRMEEMQPHMARDLKSLAFTLTTHFHGDHFRPWLCAALADNDTVWIVPDFAPMEHREVLLAAQKKVRFVKPGDVLTVEGHRIHVLPGHHFDDGGSYGIESVTYAVETPDRRLYFPGDMRDFRTCMQVDYPQADVLFAHVWLGRTNALEPLENTFFDAYCDYLERAQAKQVYFTHLYDLVRKETQMWTDRHALAIGDELCKRNPMMRTSIPIVGRWEAL